MDKFHLHSGERQTGTRLKDIRTDHLVRYKFVSEFLTQNFGSSCRKLYGLDAFCGNGYGSYLLSDTLNCFIHGIDGSNEAITQAHHHYSTPKTFFSAKAFPFVLPESYYDFAISFESIEHVDDYENLFSTVAGSVKPKGYVFISFPNRQSMSLDKNPNPFHYRHLILSEIETLSARIGGLRLKRIYGQDVYILDENEVICGHLPVGNMGLRCGYDRGQFLILLFQKYI